MISARIDSLTSVHQTLVIVYNDAPWESKAFARRATCRTGRAKGSWGESRGRRSIIYTATNSLRFAGVTYCPGVAERTQPPCICIFTLYVHTLVMDCPSAYAACTMELLYSQHHTAAVTAARGRHATYSLNPPIISLDL